MIPWAEKDRPFQIAFVVALLFHLSALTVFSIVVRFQRTDVPYNTLALVDTGLLRKPAAETPPSPLVSIAMNPDTALMAPSTEPEITRQLLAALPRRMSFDLGPSDVGPLTLQKLEQALRSQNTEPAAPSDTWKSMTRQLRETGEFVGQLVSGSRQDHPEDSAVDPNTHQLRLGDIAPGVVAKLEWWREPFDRRPDMAPPLQLPPSAALSGVTTPRLTEPVTIVIRINARGEVVNVLPPAAPDPSGSVDALVRALKRYKFRPLSSDESQHDQIGALTLEPAPQKE